MAASSRSAGEVAGESWVQSLPSHSQVSPAWALPPLPKVVPPKRTVRPRRLSKAIAAKVRPGGVWALVR